MYILSCATFIEKIMDIRYKILFQNKHLIISPCLVRVGHLHGADNRIDELYTLK